MTQETRKARELRRTMTRSEVLLWSQLRGKRVGGHKFRRQQPIGPHIVDFVCMRGRLIVEVDGDSHNGRRGHRCDPVRDEWLAGFGYRVLRVSSVEVEENVQEVVSRIAEALEGHTG